MESLIICIWSSIINFSLDKSFINLAFASTSFYEEKYKIVLRTCKSVSTPFKLFSMFYLVLHKNLFIKVLSLGNMNDKRDYEMVKQQS